MNIYIVETEGEEYWHEPFTNKRDAQSMCRDSAEDGSGGDFVWGRVDACEHIRRLHGERLELRDVVRSLVYAIGEAKAFDTVNAPDLAAALDKARPHIEFAPEADYAHDEICRMNGIQPYNERFPQK